MQCRLNITFLWDIVCGTEVTGLTVYTVKTEVQDRFFSEVNKELQKVEDFFRGKHLSHASLHTRI